MKHSFKFAVNSVEGVQKRSILSGLKAQVSWQTEVCNQTINQKLTTQAGTKIMSTRLTSTENQ